MQRRALIAGMAAFLGVFVSGSVLVSLMRHADEADAAATPSASHSGTPTSPQPEPGPVVDAYLAWVPDGLPPGYGATIAQLPTVGKIAVVASDTIWMTSSSDADGNLIDEPPAPYMIPIDAIAIDPQAVRAVPALRRRARSSGTSSTDRRSWDRRRPSSATSGRGA